MATDAVHALFRGDDSEEARVGASLFAAVAQYVLPDELGSAGLLDEEG